MTRTMTTCYRRRKASGVRSRRGSLMVCALVCMAIVISLVAMIAQNASTSRRETRIRLQLHQTERLLDAGILRSRLQQSRDSNYQGETWEPQIELAGTRVPATVTISVDENQTKVIARLGTAPTQTTESYTYIMSPEQ